MTTAKTEVQKQALTKTPSPSLTMGKGILLVRAWPFGHLATGRWTRTPLARIPFAVAVAKVSKMLKPTKSILKKICEICCRT